MKPGVHQGRRRAGLWLGSASLAAILTAALPAQAANPSPEAAADEAAMEAVCGSCHNLELVTQRVRSESEWLDIFHRMVELGATGTDEQFDAVGHYILTRLTLVRINEAPADELARVLDVPKSVAAAIVARRQRQRFRDATDLASMPGLDLAAISEQKTRIIF